jgi:hypothetical protein
MRRMLVLAAVAAAVLATAPAAAAKEVKQAQVCGPNDCATVDDEQSRAILLDGGPPRTPPTAAPYYDVRLTMAEGDEEATWSFAAVPARHAMRADDGTWMDMPAEMSALVTKVAAGREPYPAGELLGWAAPESPAQPAAADSSDSPLWPEGVVIALLAIGAAFLVRGLWLRGAARRA